MSASAEPACFSVAYSSASCGWTYCLLSCGLCRAGMEGLEQQQEQAAEEAQEVSMVARPLRCTQAQICCSSA